MTREEISALVERVVEALRRHDVAGLVREYADDCVLESPTAGGQVLGRDAVEQVYRAWFTAFPDLRVTNEKVLIEGERAVQVATAAGTDMGGFMGLAPSRKTFRIPVVFLYTLKDGQIVHERRITDFTGLLVQIGILKTKPA